MGTCGTCAVVVEGAEGCTTPMGTRERVRLSLPPHSGATSDGARGALRLACQCALLPDADVRVAKPAGFWGQKAGAGANTGGHADVLADGFAYSAISRYEPHFPRWLQRELRSNHAGETGAVSIYEGALWAMKLRWRVPGGREGGGSAGDGYEKELVGFCQHHAASERAHLVALNRILEPRLRSVLLPAWRAAGFALGAVSTLWCPRGIYVTTDAVETFVEQHYNAQIARLEAGDRVGVGVGDGAGDVGAGAGAEAVKGVADGKAELVRVLRWACEDEVAHKEEARLRAQDERGGQPWFEWIDPAWRWVVGTGSAAAAELARRI
eukprot:g5301.t1